MWGIKAEESEQILIVYLEKNKDLIYSFLGPMGQPEGDVEAKTSLGLPCCWPSRCSYSPYTSVQPGSPGLLPQETVLLTHLQWDIQLH